MCASGWHKICPYRPAENFLLPFLPLVNQFFWRAGGPPSRPGGKFFFPVAFRFPRAGKCSGGVIYRWLARDNFTRAKGSSAADQGSHGRGVWSSERKKGSSGAFLLFAVPFQPSSSATKQVPDDLIPRTGRHFLTVHFSKELGGEKIGWRRLIPAHPPGKKAGHARRRESGGAQRKKRRRKIRSGCFGREPERDEK